MPVTITLLVEINEVLGGAVLVTKGLFYMKRGSCSYQSKDSRRRNNFSLGKKFLSVWCSSREGIRHGGRKPQKYNLGPSALFTGVNHNNQFVVTPNEMVDHYCRDYPLNDPQLFFFWFVPSTRILQAKTVYMALGRSTMILVLGIS